MKHSRIVLCILAILTLAVGCTSTTEAPEEPTPIATPVAEETVEESDAPLDLAELLKNNPDAIAAAANASPATIQDAIEQATARITDDILYFDYNMYSIKEEYSEMLQIKAELLKNFPEYKIRIEGNCDARGTQEYNLALGERRARAAYQYFVRLGVDPKQLSIVSYGKERPAVEGDSESDYAANRRDNFNVTSQPTVEQVQAVIQNLQ